MDKWQSFYNELLTNIEKCKDSYACEKEQVECAFKLAVKYWEGIKRSLPGHVFKGRAAEIYFYKCIKPKFTCYVEYLSIVYLGLCYVPQGDPAIQQLFWTTESKKLKKFIGRNTDFVTYYKSGQEHHDAQYFLPENYDLGNFMVSKIYDMDGEFLTSHDHLVAILLAQEMYHEYVNKKLRSTRADI